MKYPRYRFEVSYDLLKHMLLLPPTAEILGVVSKDFETVNILVHDENQPPIPEGNRIPIARPTYRQQSVEVTDPDTGVKSQKLLMPEFVEWGISDK